MKTYKAFDFSVIDGKLIAQFKSTKELFLFTLTMIDLTEDEYYLNNGRFKNFSNLKQEHIVTDILSAKKDYNCKDIFNWIGSNVVSQWNIILLGADVYDIHIIYSFADPKEAILFRLIF
jgi:hypothetical protein